MPSDLFATLTFWQFLILLLVGLLFVRDVVVQWVRQKLGLGGGQEAQESDVGCRMDRLVEYVNHNQTEILNKILEAQREHNKLDEKVIALLENMDKYGVNCRHK